MGYQRDPITGKLTWRPDFMSNVTPVEALTKASVPAVDSAPPKQEPNTGTRPATNTPALSPVGSMESPKNNMAIPSAAGGPLQPIRMRADSISPEPMPPTQREVMQAPAPTGQAPLATRTEGVPEDVVISRGKNISYAAPTFTTTTDEKTGKVSTAISPQGLNYIERAMPIAEAIKTSEEKAKAEQRQRVIEQQTTAANLALAKAKAAAEGADVGYKGAMAGRTAEETRRIQLENKAMQSLTPSQQEQVVMGKAKALPKAGGGPPQNESAAMKMNSAQLMAKALEMKAAGNQAAFEKYGRWAMDKEKQEQQNQLR